MKSVAIIGTAGRDKNRPMTRKLWDSMWNDASGRVVSDDIHLVSGGAAWADHLAVVMFLNGECKHLTLHLPAPINETGFFVGPDGSCGSTSNFYHQRFSSVIGVSSRNHLRLAREMGATITEAPPAKGMAAFFTRNAMVARDATYGTLAYTWGEGREPADGGTMDTWRKCTGRRVHIPLSSLES